MDESSGKNTTVTRRQALRDIGAAGVGLTALGGGLEALLAQAASAAPKHGALKDIEHVIIFMQENRSFDHYFGTLRGVRGFGDKRNHKAFLQKGTNRQDRRAVPTPEAVPAGHHPRLGPAAPCLGRRQDGRLPE